MEKEQFNQIISDIHLLQDADVKELRQLIERYPWFQLPRILLVKKMQIEHSPHFDEALKKAATYIYDRSVLFQLIERTTLRKMQIAGVDDKQVEVPLHTIPQKEVFQVIEEKEMKVEEIIPDEILEELMINEKFETAIISEQKEDEATFVEETPEEPLFEFNLYELQMLKEKNDATLGELVKDITGKTISSEEAVMISQTEIHTFIEWLQLISGPSKGSLVILNENHKPRKVLLKGRMPSSENFDEQDADILATKSLHLHDHLITETYAQILALQGKKQRAAQMYEKLRLKYPQKSAYFAEKIKEL
ncbi:MAG: hypothetical protein ACKVPJ_00580 [Chitinophagales bacterium]